MHDRVHQRSGAKTGDAQPEGHRKERRCGDCTSAKYHARAADTRGDAALGDQVRVHVAGGRRQALVQLSGAADEADRAPEDGDRRADHARLLDQRPHNVRRGAKRAHRVRDGAPGDRRCHLFLVVAASLIAAGHPHRRARVKPSIEFDVRLLVDAVAVHRPGGFAFICRGGHARRGLRRKARDARLPALAILLHAAGPAVRAAGVAVVGRLGAAISLRRF
mmetsp:Transcript_53042/g.152863  ORF Transcript_53042/g.152863 Transcript_53042/m.152863 type:complete len:220 (+) Transcript_53042:201-860(+)